MNQIRNRITEIDAELVDLRARRDTLQAAITTTRDDLSNVARMGRLLRDLATTAHSYDGVPWLAEALGIPVSEWADRHDDARGHLARLEDTLRDALKDAKGAVDQIKKALTTLEYEHETLERTEKAIHNA